MSEVWQSLLTEAWSDLSKHASQARQFRTKRLSTDVASAYAGRRSIDDAPCLLVEGSINPTNLFEVGGMRLGAYHGETGSLLALTLEDQEQADLFLTVCGDVLASAVDGSPHGYLSRFIGRLEAWRGFLRERRAGLSKNETVGLIGELMMLEKLISIRQDLLLTWASPDDGLHDFLRAGVALEVKTCMGPTTRLRVSTLDQLDSSGLHRLTLIHTRLIERADGRNLGTIIDHLNGLIDTESRRLLSNALLKRGLMPDDRSAHESPMVEEHESVAYIVSDQFPRLIRAQLPVAILDAEYSLELRALNPFATDLQAALSTFASSTL